jgi:hypothetical protein
MRYDSQLSTWSPLGKACTFGLDQQLLIMHDGKQKWNAERFNVQGSFILSAWGLADSTDLFLLTGTIP